MFTEQELYSIEKIVRNAGKIILDIYRTDFDVDYKQDESPLTIADQQANDYLVSQLKSFFPTIEFITEETQNAPFKTRSLWDLTWIIDPLDGTKEFIKKNDEFTVNVALCQNNEIIFGAIYVPVTGEYFYAQKGQGAYKIHKKTKEKLTAQKPQDTLIAVASRSHKSQAVDTFIEEFHSKFNEIKFVAAGSSLKLCLVAEGKAHIYPRLGPTMEWDVAAGIIIAQEAGATVYRFDNQQQLTFNKQNLLNPFFIVSSL